MKHDNDASAASPEIIPDKEITASSNCDSKPDANRDLSPVPGQDQKIDIANTEHTDRKDTPTVSVLLCVYYTKDSIKREEHLLGAVQSVIDQTFTDWEMILYDDGSDAAGKEILRKAAALDPRIRPAGGGENKGLAFGLNTSLQLARGRYIARMDDDDISAPERLARQVDFLETHPEYQWTGCCLELMDDGGIWGFRDFPEKPESRDFLRFSPYAHPTIMFRRETLVQTNGYRHQRKAEDYELFMRLYAKGLQGFNLQERIYYYREDRAVSRPQPYGDRIKEVRVRYKGYCSLGIMGPKALFFALKPLAVGLLPKRTAAGFKHRLRHEYYEK